MFRKLCLAGLFALQLPAAAALDRAQSGLYYNPQQTGHGFEVTALDSRRAAVTWYTYTPGGAPLWLSGVLEEDANGVLQGGLSIYQGMRFGSFSPSTNQRQDWGTLRISFSDCNRGRVEYTSTQSSNGQAYGSGAIDIQRLAGVSGLACGNAALAGLYYGYVQSTVQGVSANGYALLEADGGLTLVIPNSSGYFGSYTRGSGDALTFTSSGLTVPNATFPGGGSTITLQGSGAARAGDYVRANYTTSGTDSGVMSFWLVPESNRDVPLSALAGSYSDASIGFNATLNASGELTGSDGRGCSYSGRLTPLAEPGNAYTLNVTLSNCGSANGSHSGKAAVVDFAQGGDNRGMLVALRTPGNALVSLLQRN